ncbi:alpha/beta fold hydrolase [Novacetimonas hansenii]|uniref:Alpha/beta hydrolase n=2 Tax=Novacetimonas hansenii TaxID=436 RepID=A0AAW5EPF5_NOVHA|nr:alpha/beta hydrolase [Novacetimonas hansenii]EFG84031.1 hypothetical protein GXY_10224 [Novacetimonas hansenii ATCC 23769]MCJ8353612.1 alpha/beta hydrolase [Novacetimonas hansenii]RFP03313.1 hypothetical protein BGC30_11135 [Novacetimonas hansenii]WEQ59339.1 alpha/beta hydrolase [Novacetimonas hansenii]CUW47041.1 Pimeloyl-[acyl-carrier protein] methyl ester esterase [Novacetimonas hansenii]
MPATDLPLVFVHGWAFGPEIWDQIRAARPNHTCQMLDFGYFSSVAQTETPQRPFIAIGHSLGALWLLSTMPQHCRGMVLINGFARFTASDDFPHGVPPRLLTRMARKLATAPDDTVRDFRQKAGTDLPLPGPSHPQRLHDGLHQLLTLDARQDMRMAHCPVSCIAGTGDPIAPPPLTQGSFAPATTIEWHDGGHLLPLTHPDACLQAIDHMMKRMTP